jgi:signal transduction histidine kinase
VRFEVALVVTLALVAGFGVVGGVWAPPPMESSGIHQHIATVVRAIQAAPPEERAKIAAAASDDEIKVSWHDGESAVAQRLALNGEFRDGTHLLRDWLGKDLHRVVLFDSRRPVSHLPELHADFVAHPRIRFMAVNYGDDSWVIFAASVKQFWLSRNTRLMMWLAYMALAIIAVQALAAWQLSRPIVKLSDAVRLFGANSSAPPIAESGPKEMRDVIKSFNAMRAQIQKFMAYRVAMLAAISHDLRTPLTRMRLRGEFIEDEEQQQRLFRDVDEMQAMVEGALAFFRDDAAEEDATQIDLPGILKTIANDFADHGVEIAYEGPAHAVCHGRPFALKRAFTNLVENAVKYAGPPGIMLRQEADRLVVTVRDGGPGIPEEAMEKVFNPYFRVESSRNRTSGGVGLGLTAAQSIIRGHGGEIVLKNRPEGGLDAEVTLPV